MKDRFFKLLERIYDFIYYVVLKITYEYYALRLTFQLPDIGANEKTIIKKYWKLVAEIRIDTKEYKWYKNKNIEVTPKIIPNSVYHSTIEPFFNNIHMLKGFSDKNYIDLLIGREYAPNTLIHCINGQLLDFRYLPIEDTIFTDMPDEMICKPSVDSCGGKGIQFLKKAEINPEQLSQLIRQYNGNFVIQEIINQHSFFSQFNPDSVNTIRILSFLFKDEVYVLSSFLRVGAKGNHVDNVSAGGYYIPIDNNWRLKSFAISKEMPARNLIYHSSIPNQIQFGNLIIPNHDIISNTIKQLHYRLSHFGLINWDVVVDEDNHVKVVEYNLIDTSPHLHQIGIGPLFGDLTDEVLATVFKKEEK